MTGVDGYYLLKGFNDGKMTKEEFEEYYSLVGASITEDDLFEEFLNCAWMQNRSVTSRQTISPQVSQ